MALILRRVIFHQPNIQHHKGTSHVPQPQLLDVCLATMNNGQQTNPSAAELANQHQRLMSLNNRDRIAVCSDAARSLGPSIDTRAASSSSSVADSAFITEAADTPSFDPRLSIRQHDANSASSNNPATAMNQTQSVTYASNNASSASATNMPQTHPAFVGYGTSSAPCYP